MQGVGREGVWEKTPKPRGLSPAAASCLGSGKAGHSQKEPLTQENPFTFPKAAVPSRSSPPLPFCQLSEGKRISHAKAPVALGSSPEGSPSHLSCPLQSGSSPEPSGSRALQLLLTAPRPLLPERSEGSFLSTQRDACEEGKPRHLRCNRCAAPKAPGQWIKRTGKSLMPQALCGNCRAGDPLAGPTVAVAAKAGGALAVVLRPSSRLAWEAEEGDEAEAGETVKGTLRACIVTAPRR